MRASLFITLLLAGFAMPTWASQRTSAFGALKLIPKEDLKQLAQIIGPEGAPQPERWYILVHSDTSDTGLKEFVVEDGELVATRQVSQFAESLSPDAVISGTKLKTDSDKLAKLAEEYARANGSAIGHLTFHLAKGTEENEARWRVTCLDEEGQQLGVLSANPSNGQVTSHEGFAAVPTAKSNRKGKQLKLKTEARPQVAADEEWPEEQVSRVAAVETQSPEPIAESARSARDSRTSGVERRTSVRKSRGATIPNPVTAVRDVTRPLRRTIGRILPF